MHKMSYLGLDITAGVLPFLRRFEAAGGGGGGGSGSDTVFCRLGRREDGGFAGSGSSAGLGSRAGAFRFRDGGGGREDEAVAGTGAVEGPAVVSDELAALADARVTRELEEDMSTGF